MNRILLTSTLLAAITLAACEKPTTVNVPASVVAVPVAVPGPAGPTGATGATGMSGADGTKGEPGKPGDSTTVIVTPRPATPPSN